jgi:hypothetical protein
MKPNDKPDEVLRQGGDDGRNPNVALADSDQARKERILIRPLRILRIACEVGALVGLALVFAVPLLALLGVFLVIISFELFALWTFLRSAEEATIRHWW